MLNISRFKALVLLLVLYFIFPESSVFAQQVRYTISGYVKDARTGEELIGASVTVKEIPTTGATTNAYGFYSLSIPEGNYTISAQYLGYDLKSTSVNLQKNTRLDFAISSKESQLKEVEI